MYLLNGKNWWAGIGTLTHSHNGTIIFCELWIITGIMHNSRIYYNPHSTYIMMKMMMMMINCFCGMVDRRKTFSFISSRDHCQRSSPSRISDTPRAGFEPAQNPSSGLVEWSCAVVITSTPWRHKFNCLLWQLYIYTFHFSLNIKQLS